MLKTGEFGCNIVPPIEVTLSFNFPPPPQPGQQVKLVHRSLQKFDSCSGQASCFSDIRVPVTLQGYLRVASSAPRFAQPHSQLEWSYYQAGPANDTNPLVFLHGTSSTAAAFFYQVMSLSDKGYCVVSAQYPAYAGPDEWCKGFDLFLDSLRYRAVHLVGAGLGGFLAQHFACKHRSRVRSLVLCNSFASTHAFAMRAGTWGSLISLMPTAFLRQAMQDTLPQAGFMEMRAKQAVDWVGQQLNDLSGDDLASRLNLNVNGNQVGPLHFENHEVTVLESSGDTMVPEELRQQLKILYKGASFAELKSRGDFPYLSRPDEVTLFVEVHMRRFGAFAQGRAIAATLLTRSFLTPVVDQLRCRC
ncbi:spg21 [Symbiodinium natans]|uniref:Maspardin n=1 Tax=Symbiodinium natans TaxID=878477 RepID=A0A812T346_9DINO|nr:spg21 [Symbiodinium natans]